MSRARMPWWIRYPLAVAFIPVALLVTIALMMIDVFFLILPMALIEMVTEFAGDEIRLDWTLLADRWFDWLQRIRP
jgi:hypothetical protein